MSKVQKQAKTTIVNAKASHLHIRASEQDKGTLARAARLKKLSVSQFVLESALPLAEEIVNAEAAEVQTFRLDAHEWERFAALLDAPPRSLPALRELLNSKPVWEV